MSSVAYLIYLALSIYSWMIIIQVVLSWLQLRRGTVLYRIYRVLYDATEPYLALFQRLIPTARIGGAGLDLSPVVGILVLYVAMRVVAHF